MVQEVRWSALAAGSTWPMGALLVFVPKGSQCHFQLFAKLLEHDAPPWTQHSSPRCLQWQLPIGGAVRKSASVAPCLCQPGVSERDLREAPDPQSQLQTGVVEPCGRRVRN